MKKDQLKARRRKSETSTYQTNETLPGSRRSSKTSEPVQQRHRAVPHRRGPCENPDRGERPPLSLRNRNGGASQQDLPTLGSHKGGARGSGTGLLRHCRRHGRQGCVEQSRVRWLEAVMLQHSEYSRHQPERRRRHLQLSPEQTLNPFHLRKGDGSPTLGPQSLSPRELRERRVHRKMRRTVGRRPPRNDATDWAKYVRGLVWRARASVRAATSDSTSTTLG